MPVVCDEIFKAYGRVSSKTDDVIGNPVCVVSTQGHALRGLVGDNSLGSSSGLLRLYAYVPHRPRLWSYATVAEFWPRVSLVVTSYGLRGWPWPGCLSE